MHISTARVNYIAWLTNAKRPSIHTVRAYASDIEQLERTLGPTFDVRRLAQRHIVDFVAAQRAADISEASIRRRLAALRGFFTWLESEHLTPSDRFAISKIEVRVAKRLPRAIAEPNLKTLLRLLTCECRLHELGPDGAIAVHHRSATTLLATALMLATGLRVGEVTTAHAADTHSHNGTIRVLGKGSRERVVYFNGSLLESLVPAYLRRREHVSPTHPYTLHLQDGRPLRTDAMRRRLAAAAQRAGLTQPVTPHALRHSAATQLIESGVDMRYVQRLLGHASISTTELYTAVSDVALSRAIHGARVLDRLTALG